MQFPESWLREFCDPALTTQELADVLTMAGLEVEEMRPAAPAFHGVVVGVIVEAEQHPNADRLRVCKVDAGSHSATGLLQVVCGAPNARVGLRVPLAMVGAALPIDAQGKSLSIKVGALRGVDSHGMLCSARELGLGDDQGGLLELAADAPLGADIRAHLRLDDTVFTLKLTPNLAHCLSVYGIARELSALTGAPLKPAPHATVTTTHDEVLPVDVQAADLCGRFSGRVIRDVNTRAQTPAWMLERLQRCGQRAVSPLVDISNYVMFECGQPSHIFDRDKIASGLTVRWAREGEQLKLLNGETVALDAQVGVIADGEQVESLAGIMGGDATAVGDDTRNIYVEAAFWWPKAVVGRSRRYNFSTDAGHRFERGVDPAQTVAQVERITQLIQSICGGQAGPLDDQTLQLPAAEPVTLRVARASRVIGMPVTQAQCAEVFTRLGLPFTEDDGQLTVTPPTWRFDVRIEEDLIEEVIRVMGFDKLPDTPPLAPVRPRVRPENQRSTHALRHRMAALDYQESINFSFVEAAWERDFAACADPIRLLNPISAPLAVMRSTLIGSLLHVLRHNLARKAARVRVFEIGRVFLRDATVLDGPQSVAGVRQPLRLAGLAYGSAEAVQWGQRERAIDFFDARGDVEALLAPRKPSFVAATHPALHPGRCARVELDGQAIGWVGELHPQWRQAYELPHAPMLFEIDLAALQEREVPSFRTIARQQSASRDLALVVSDTVSHDELISTIMDADSPLLRSAVLFDLYKPVQGSADLAQGERSLAVRLELRDDDATLTDERIEAAIAVVVKRLGERLSARLRA